MKRGKLILGFVFALFLLASTGFVLAADNSSVPAEVCTTITSQISSSAGKCSSQTITTNNATLLSSRRKLYCAWARGGECKAWAYKCYANAYFDYGVEGYEYDSSTLDNKCNLIESSSNNFTFRCRLDDKKMHAIDSVWCIKPDLGCLDTDGGVNKYLRGEASGRISENNDTLVTRNDFCVALNDSEDELAECSGSNCGVYEFGCVGLDDESFVEGNVVPCEYGCENGACGRDIIDLGNYTFEGEIIYTDDKYEYALNDEAVVMIRGNVLPKDIDNVSIIHDVRFGCDGATTANKFISDFPTFNEILVDNEGNEIIKTFNADSVDVVTNEEGGIAWCNANYYAPLDYETNEKYSVISSFSGEERFVLRFTDISEFEDNYVLNEEYGPSLISTNEDLIGTGVFTVDYEFDAFTKSQFTRAIKGNSDEALSEVNDIAGLEFEIFNLVALEDGNSIYLVRFAGKESIGEVAKMGAIWASEENFVGYIVEVRDYASSVNVDADEFIDALVGEDVSFEGELEFSMFDEESQQLIRDYLEIYPSTLTEEDLDCIPEWECTIKPLVCPEYGQQIKSCTDLRGCAEDTEEVVDCTPGLCSGCLLDDKCVPYGHRLLNEEDVPVYCAIDGSFKEQKTKDSEGNWASCQNNYECESNICSSGECIEAASLIQEAGALKGIFIRVLCRLANLFDQDDYGQCINQYLGNSA